MSPQLVSATTSLKPKLTIVSVVALVAIVSTTIITTTIAAVVAWWRWRRNDHIRNDSDKKALQDGVSSDYAMENFVPIVTVSIAVVERNVIHH